MKTHRTKTESAQIQTRDVGMRGAESRYIVGDNRELMRHSDGSLHVALVVNGRSGPRLNVLGAHAGDADLVPLSGPIGKGNAGDPATDSNQNGVYIAFTQQDERGSAGYVARIPDLFNDGKQIEISDALTPLDGAAENSFLQGSRGYNSVAYAWRDRKKGVIYAGVSKDGHRFPEARVVVKDRAIVGGPAIGVYADLVILTYQTASKAFAPDGYEGEKGNFYAYMESGDGGDTWSKPSRLVDHVRDLPPALAYSVGQKGDPERMEVPLSGASILRTSMQSLVWEPFEGPDKRIFALTTFTAEANHPSGVAEEVGVLTWKPPILGATWKHVLTNRAIFRRAGSAAKGAKDRQIGQFKYCALPGTSVRVVAYVEKSAAGVSVEDRVVLLVSTNMGDSFDHEASYSASDLGLGNRADVTISNSACTHIDGNGDLWQDLLVGDLKKPAKLRHALLPVGINVQGTDATQSW